MNNKILNEILIIGAGPAGLFSALILSEYKGLKISIIDSGLSINHRNHAKPENLVSGVGGAGLFSDGKLCIDLNVGGYLNTVLTNVELNDITNKILKYIFTVMPELQFSRNKHVKFQDYKKESQEKFYTKNYPVLNIGTDRGKILIERLVSLLSSRGINIESSTKVSSIKKNQNKFEISTLKVGASELRYYDEVISALGKVGAEQQSETCKSLGIKQSSNPMYIGVRLETNSDVLSSLFKSSSDPKIKISLPDGSHVKTHCASNNGEVAYASYSGYPMAVGHQYNNYKSGRSGFALLWDGIRYSGNDDSHSYAKSILKRFKDDVGEGLALQSLPDFLNNQQTQLIDNGLNITCKNYKQVNLWDLFPKEVCLALKIMIEALIEKFPNLNQTSTVLYAPVIEWWMSTVNVNGSSMETSLPGYYVCGDGSGWSQGIVHAAATGILAAENIISKAEFESNDLKYLNSIK